NNVQTVKFPSSKPQFETRLPDTVSHGDSVPATDAAGPITPNTAPRTSKCVNLNSFLHVDPGQNPFWNHTQRGQLDSSCLKLVLVTGQVKKQGLGTLYSLPTKHRPVRIEYNLSWRLF